MNKIAASALAAAFAGLCLSGGAHAATATGPVEVLIINSLAITNTVGLQFGQVAPGASTGTVAVTPLGVRTGLGGVALASGTPATAASFTVTGSPLHTYAISLPSSVSLTPTTGSGDPMTVDNFISLPSAASGGLLDAGGSQTLLVGATLNVGVNQEADSYTGTFDVTVAYN